MAKKKSKKPKKPKSKKGKKKGKKIDLKQKTPEELFLEQLIATATERLKKEKWDAEDAQLKMKQKKLPKIERIRLALKRKEELQYAVEQERLRLIEEEHRRQEEERKRALEKDAKDQYEQSIRFEQLTESCDLIGRIERFYLRNEAKSLANIEWEQYLKCDGLPDPSNCGQMNTYLHLWDRYLKQTTIKQAELKTYEILSLLDTLDDLLDCPTVSKSRALTLLTIRNAFRQYQQNSLDSATYQLLRDVDGQLTRLDIPTASFARRTDGKLALCLWALVQLPVPMPNPKRPPRRRVELVFPELDLETVFPSELNVWAACVRAMYVAYDHFSHLCRTAQVPTIPAELLRDLKEDTLFEWNHKRKTISGTKQQVKVLEPNISGGTTQENPNASTLYLEFEDDLYTKFRQQFRTTVSDDELNLRKYRIIGGVFFLDLFYQPPQPTTMVQREITFSTLQIPKWLSEVPFHVSYEAPVPPQPGVTRQPEEIEAEMKKQEEEFDRLISITVSLPAHVLWLDAPIVCQWRNHKWCTGDVHDLKHNEDKQTVQFRTGLFGPFAMAMYRYVSMPYQAWEMRPCTDGTTEGVLVSIVAAVLVVEFIVRMDGCICLSQLQNAPSDALDSIIGIYHKFPKLKRLLQQGGVDLFPDPDAFCYMSSGCEKHWPMERHLYFNMAQCAHVYNFAWSRWNLTAGRRKAVLQMRELPTSERVKLSNHLMVMVTPLQALFVDCTEVSQTFVDDGIASGKFCSDLYHLILNTASSTTKRKIQKVPCKLVHTVTKLLNEIRLFSFS